MAEQERVGFRRRRVDPVLAVEGHAGFDQGVGHMRAPVVPEAGGVGPHRVHPEGVGRVIAQAQSGDPVSEGGHDRRCIRVGAGAIVGGQAQQADGRHIGLPAGQPGGRLEAVNADRCAGIAYGGRQSGFGAQVSLRQRVGIGRVNPVENAHALAQRPQTAHGPPAQTLVAGAALPVDRALPVVDEVIEGPVFRLHVAHEFQRGAGQVEQGRIARALVLPQVDNRRAGHVIDATETFPGGIDPLVVRILSVDVHQGHFPAANGDRLGEVDQVIEVDQIGLLLGQAHSRPEGQQQSGDQQQSQRHRLTLSPHRC